MNHSSSESSAPATSTFTIATHDGVFHADDVFAVAVLLLVYVQAKVLRTRDAAKLATADIVVDVGGLCDVMRCRFDHHQRGRAGARENGVLFSSFGLVWQVYAAQLLPRLGVPDEHREAVATTIDKVLVQPVDALDNGQNLYKGGETVFEGISSMSMSHVLSGFNPTWADEQKDYDKAFLEAVAFAQAILRNQVRYVLGGLLATEGVRHAIQAANEGPLVLLPRFLPWAEQVRDEAPNAMFVIFPSETGTWMVQAINKTPGTFESRRLLPETWAGLRDQDFARVTAIEDAVFCHPGRFICGAKTQASALQLAKLALE